MEVKTKPTSVCAGTVWFLDISLQTCLPFSTSIVDQLVVIWLLGMLVIEGVIGRDTEETGMDFKYGWCAHLQGELEL